jgi:hypothetical protein
MLLGGLEELLVRRPSYDVRKTNLRATCDWKTCDGSSNALRSTEEHDNSPASTEVNRWLIL